MPFSSFQKIMGKITGRDFTEFDHTSGKAVPSLSPQEKKGLKDYWRIYTVNREVIGTEILQRAVTFPEFKNILQNQEQAQERNPDNSNGQDLQERAIFFDEWEPYLKNLEIQGIEYARKGLEFEAWFKLIAVFREIITPYLIEAYGDDPQRLLDTINGMDFTIDLSMGVIGEGYLAAKETIIRQQQEAIGEMNERKKAEARFRSLMESAPYANVIVDKSGRITLVNSQTERLFGYTRDEILGLSVDALVPSRFRQVHPGHRDNYLSSPRFRPMGAGLELFGLRKDGSEFPVEVSLSPLETEEGLLVIASVRDVTERKRFEQALRDKNIELENANLAKDRFLASMSHELRTPLNAIMGFTGTLLMKLPGPLTPQQEKQLKTIQTSAKHLLSLINDLLDVAKVESGKVELNLEPIVCQSMLEEIRSTLQPMAEMKGLQFELNMPAEPVTLKTDRRAFSQIIINLANNAIKFTEAGSVRIEMAAKEPLAEKAGQVEIDVIDTGVGIRPEDQDKLFKAFERIETTYSRRIEGTGLGLYLSQKLALLLGAQITFNSDFGKGSTFHLVFPLAG